RLYRKVGSEFTHYRYGRLSSSSEIMRCTAPTESRMRISPRTETGPAFCVGNGIIFLAKDWFDSGAFKYFPSPRMRPDFNDGHCKIRFVPFPNRVYVQKNMSTLTVVKPIPFKSVPDCEVTTLKLKGCITLERLK